MDAIGKEGEDMKHKIVIVTFAMLLIPVFVGFTWGEDYDFRKVTWGMSKEEVKASETFKPTDEDDRAIRYKTMILGRDVRLEYIFANGKLWRTIYFCPFISQREPKSEPILIL